MAGRRGAPSYLSCRATTVMVQSESTRSSTSRRGPGQSASRSASSGLKAKSSCTERSRQAGARTGMAVVLHALYGSGDCQPAEFGDRGKFPPQGWRPLAWAAARLVWSAATGCVVRRESAAEPSQVPPGGALTP